MSQQSGVFQVLAEMAGVGNQQQIIKYATPIHLFPTKNRLALLGTVGAGKSTVVGGLVMTAETLVAETKKTNEPFFCRVIEGSSEIHQDVSDLREGHFPAKTVAFGDFAAEAGLLLEWEFNVDLPVLGQQTLRRKLLQVPICDIAGEDLQQTIRQFRKQQGFIGDYAKQKVRNLIAYVRESDGYIITIKATRAKGFRKQLEKEADPKLSPDPDVNLVRLLEDLMNYKALNRSRPIKGVAVVITAWDRMKEVADEVGFDILDPNMGQHDLERFVAACFPSTYAAIQSLRVPNVQYFPSFFEVETDEQGNIKYHEDMQGGPKIKQRRPDYEVGGDWWRNIRKISYSEKAYVDLIQWLKNFAMGM